MKKFLAFLLCVILSMGLIACTAEDHTGQAKTPAKSSEMKGKDYKEVQAMFEENGFTNIKLEKIEDLITGWLTSDGEVEEVSIGGDVEYSSYVWVDASSEVIIKYHTFKEKSEEIEIPQDDNSMDNEETSITDEEFIQLESESSSQVEEENVYKYVKRGQEYNVYYVIDFDNSTVKYGTDDYEEPSIGTFEDGDLNEGIAVTFFEGTEDEYVDWIHWHYVNQDSVLILVDNDGFEWEFQKTNTVPEIFE